MAAGGDLKKANKFANCIARCLLEGDDITKVIDLLPPAELHLLIGAVNVMLNLLIKIFGLERVQGWLKSVGVIRHGYQGGGTDGNNSKRVLDEVDQLAAILPPETGPIIANLRSLKVLVSGNFFLVFNMILYVDIVFYPQMVSKHKTEFFIKAVLDQL